jgi:hypothetical protein
MARTRKAPRRTTKTRKLLKAGKPTRAARVKAKATKPVKAVVKKPVKKKRSIRYYTPLAKKLIIQKAVRFKKFRHPEDGQGIEFRVPTSWKETWGSEDNALFYPPVAGIDGPTPITGRLFVRFRLEPVGDANDGAAFGLLLSHRTDDSQTVTELESGAFMLHFQSRHNSEGYHALDYYWFLAKPFPPRRIGLASFLFSGVAELFDGDKAPEAHVIAMLEKEIPKAIFDQERLPVHHDE